MLLTAVHIDDNEVINDSVIKTTNYWNYGRSVTNLRSYHCDFTIVSIWLLL